ncbi:transglutaminase family protein [Mycetocola spongiae]|uniref:transglutaminase family protein n=1 Tax=Mycetocola spongiae TaxID=2859226 RepID=UPI001CF0F5AA|nr:DUF3488 and transglutaminase-like domain-containing protein [Mycetocola spongiae]UCR88221.1 DUF3488 and transglutaminase-like domain-containing protein [Mycetocola spongiae]
MSRPVLPVRPCATREWRIAAATLAVLAAGLWGFGPVFAGRGWWWVSVAVAAVILLIIGLMRQGLSPRMRRALPRELLAWGAGALTGVLLLTALWAPRTALWGVIPTPSTRAGISEVIGAGLAELAAGRAPMQVSWNVTLLTALIAAVLILILSALTLLADAALPAALLAGALVLVPLVAIAPGFDMPTCVLCAVATLWLLAESTARRAERRDRVILRARGNRPVALGLGAVALITTLVITPALPVPTAPPGSSGSGIRGQWAGGVDPLVELGRELTRPTPTVALTYRTDAARAPYLKLLNIEDLGGDIWGPTPFSGEPLNLLDGFGPVPGLAADTPAAPFAMDITIVSLSADRLPLPYPARAVSGLPGDWRWEAAGLTAYASATTTLGQSYHVEALSLSPTAEQLREATTPVDAEWAAPYLAVPEALPPIVLETAHRVAAGEAGNYDRALALQRFFRSEFSYSEEAPVGDGPNGGAASALEGFLELRRGYCVHFASAMTIMARQLGIPARLALGYLPGIAESDPDTGQRRYAVSSSQLHAWPELYFESVGWVPFEPTASRGTPTNFASASTALPAPPTVPAPVPTPGTQVPTPGTDAGTAPTGQAAAGAGLDLTRIIGGGLIALVAALILLAPRLLRLRRTVRRGRHSLASGTPAAGAWEELLDRATDLGLAPDATRTPRAFARDLAATLPPAPAALWSLLEAVERESYAPHPDPAEPTRPPILLLREVTRYLHRASPRRTRIYAFLLPRSVLGTRHKPSG